MNSSRLRSAIEAPNEAMTTMIDCPRALSLENSSQSSTKASTAVAAIATAIAISKGQPKDNGPIGVLPPRTPTTAKAA